MVSIHRWLIEKHYNTAFSELSATDSTELSCHAMSTTSAMQSIPDVSAFQSASTEQRSSGVAAALIDSEWFNVP